MTQSLLKKETLVSAPSASGAGVFDITKYGAVGNGATNDVAAIQSAVNAAMAYANSPTKTAEVYFPPGIYGVNGWIIWDGSNAGRVVFRGAPATIKLLSNGSIFLNTGDLANPNGTYGNLTVENFIVDNNNTTKFWGKCGAIFTFAKYTTQFGTLKNMTFRHCEVRNMPRPAQTTDPFTIGISIEASIWGPGDRATTCSVTDITVEDCIFGKVGYGGSFGVQIQGYIGNEGSMGGASEADQIRNPGWISNIKFDNFTMKRLWHDGGPPSQTYFSNSNYIFGASAVGGKIVCEDLYGNHSGDDGLELNSWLDADINRCVFANSQTGGAIYLGNGGWMPYPEKQRIRIRNCTFGPTDFTNGGSELILHGFAQPHGSVTIENCHFQDAGIEVWDAVQQLTVRNCTFASNAGWADGGYVNYYPIEIDAQGNTSQVIFEDIQVTMAGTYANPNNTDNSYVSFGVARFSMLADTQLSVRNIHLINKVKTSGAGIWGLGLRPLMLPWPQTVNTADFSTSGGNYAFDAGALSDITASGGKLVPSNTATLTNEVRGIAIGLNSSANIGGAGPQTDVNIEMQYTPGTTVTGFKGGVVGKAPATNTYTEAYVYDNGTISLLCLDKVVAGTRTSIIPGSATNGGAGTVTTIASPPSNVSAKGIQLNSRISTSTAFWIRYRQQGKSVRADVHSASMGTGTTVTNTASATFSTATEIQSFVQPSSYSGFVWVPISANATGDNISYTRMSVYNGIIDGVQISHNNGTPVGDLVAVTNAGTSGTVRMSGPMRLSNIGVSRHTGSASGTFGDIDNLNDLGAFFRRENSRLQNGTVNTLTAPGTGTAYTNASGYVETVHWYGGTLTAPYVELSLDGGTTWAQVRGASADGQIILQPSDQVRWTYSSAPTFKRAAFS